MQMNKLNNKLYTWIPIAIFGLFIIIIACMIINLLGSQSYVNEYTKKHYSIVIANNTLDRLDSVKLSIVNMNNENIPLITEDDILSHERRKLNLYTKDEELLQFLGASYNVVLIFQIKNEEYIIPAGYFTSEWGGFHVLLVNKNSEGNFEFDYKKEKDRIYKKLLKRHYYNPHETSWIE